MKQTGGARSPAWTIPAGVALVVLAALQPLPLCKVVGRIFGTGLIGVGFSLGTRRQKWWAAAALVGVLAFNFLWAYPSEMLAKDLSPVPLAPIAEVDAVVVPGGERVIVHPEGIQHGGAFTVCFYDQGCIVGAAHGADFPDPRWNLCTTCFASNLADGVPTFEANTQYGIVVSGVKCPDPGRQALPIAGPDDVLVGQKATLLSAGRSNAEVEVVGYIQRTQGQFLVVKMPRGGQGMGKGMSGTPLVQNGKIIGFLSGGFLWDISGRLGIARLAADVYDATKEYR